MDVSPSPILAQEMLARILSYMLLIGFAVVNVLIDRSLVQSTQNVLVSRPPPMNSYTWIEDDVPESFPLVKPRPHVIGFLEESVHYDIVSPQSYSEWRSTTTMDHEHNVHMGPKDRMGVVGVVHEMHCLRTLRDLLNKVDILEGRHLSHSEHCLSFLREHTLCAADTVLEPGDAFGRNMTAERVTGDRECMDAEAYYLSTLQNWNAWLELYQKTHNSA